jgi:two-component system cell cycle sensor histidine kinase/response regulator CckA
MNSMNAGPIGVLLIEDNLGDARMFQEALAEVAPTSFSMAHVMRLGEGLRRLEQSGIDVVLLDLSLPDATGLETVRRTHAAAPEVPIVVLTGLADEAFALKAVREGAQDYLVKGQIDGNLLVRSMRYAIERGRLLRERKLAEKALQASQDYALNIIESSLDMIIAVDQNGQIREFNKAAQKTFGYAPQEILGKPQIVLYADAEESARIQDALIKEGKCVQQVKNMRKNGQIFPSFLSASVLRDGHGQWVGIMSTSRDITQQLNLEDQLRQAQKMESIGQLAGGIAHDFNNLLTVIQGHSCILLSSGGLAYDLTEPVQQISLAAERAAKLTRQLLAFSRKQVMQLKHLDLNELVANMSKMLRRIVGEDVALQVNYSSSPAIVKGDA